MNMRKADRAQGVELLRRRRPRRAVVLLHHDLPVLLPVAAPPPQVALPRLFQVWSENPRSLTARTAHLFQVWSENPSSLTARFLGGNIRFPSRGYEVGKFPEYMDFHRILSSN